MKQKRHRFAVPFLFAFPWLKVTKEGLPSNPEDIVNAKFRMQNAKWIFGETDCHAFFEGSQ